MDMLLYKITDQTTRGLFDGILGLAPKDDSAGPLFIDQLHQSGEIAHNVFSMFFVPRDNFNPS
jgi:hypothetical protein